ncbi:unnamed protein product [Closterium sp. NIES-53]
MPHSSEAADSPPVSQPSSPLGMQPWSREEDAVLLRHALQCGTKQWGELERSGQIKRSNKSCCNRYIFLRRKFTHHFRESFLRNHLGGAAFLQDVLLDGDSSQLLCQDFHHQQQEKQQRGGRLFCRTSLRRGGSTKESFESAFTTHLKDGSCVPVSRLSDSTTFSDSMQSLLLRIILWTRVL